MKLIFSRPLILNALIDSENKKVLTAALEIFENHKARHELSHELKIASYKAMMLYDFDRLIDEYNKAAEEERKIILMAIAGVQNSKLQKSVLRFTKELTHAQDVLLVLDAMANNFEGCKAAWMYFKNNFNDLKLINNQQLFQFVEKSTSRCKKISKDCATFFKKKNLTDYQKNVIQKILENSIAQAAKFEKEKKNLERFFKEYLCDDAE